MTIKNIVIRADGDNYIGTGHIYRCLNLASYINNSNIIFICKNINEKLKELIREKYILILIEKNNILEITKDKNTWLNDSEINDANKTIDVIKKKNIDWIIIDHYSIGMVWEKAIRPFVKKIFVIDDYIKRHDCDILLNILLKNKSYYNGLLNNSTIILHGKNYIILNKTYLNAFKTNNNNSLKTINIFMGGSDETHETIKIIKNCNKLNRKMNLNIKYDVIIGGGNKQRKEIIDLCNSYEDFNYYYNVKCIKNIFLNSELSIGLAGNTIFEKCILQTPNLLICTNNSQRMLLDEYIDAGVCIYMGNINDSCYMDNINKHIIFYYTNPSELKNVKKQCNKFLNITHLKTFKDNINIIFNGKY